MSSDPILASVLVVTIPLLVVVAGWIAYRIYCRAMFHVTGTR